MYKNWKAICQIADTHFMWALALLDLASDFGKLIEERLPEFFTDEKQAGPYPLSLMRANAYEEGKRAGDECAEDHIVSYDSVPPGIPIKIFDKDKSGRNIIGNRPAFPKLPAEIDSDAQQGDTVVWCGKKFVVLENNDGCEELYIAPAECVAVDR